MSTPGPRIPYIEREEWTDGARDVFAVMERDEAAKELARQNGSKMNIVNVLAHHPRIAVPYLEMNKFLYDLRLPMRLREIAVLRLAHLSNSAYEWFQHEEVGRRIGFSAEDIAAIKAGKPAPGWSEIDGLVMDAVTELEQSSAISDALWARLGIGAEMDFMSYLVSRYFGLRAFSRLYGLIYSSLTVGIATGPLVMGYSQQLGGTYDAGLEVLLFASALAIVPLLLLGAYPQLPRRAVAPEQP